MVVTTVHAVGFCAHYSVQGDWAFDYALRLARLHRVKLNVFHFLTDPYDRRDNPAEFAADAREKLAIEREKELRFYYDSRAGDYLNVGFRLCEHSEWVELHHCLVVHEFQVLVLGHIHTGATFARRPIEEFANSFVCPVILVGPIRPDQFLLNRQAGLIADELGLKAETWSLINGLPLGNRG